MCKTGALPTELYAQNESLSYIEKDFIYKRKSLHNLVELNTISPNIALDIRYATNNNFTKRALYPFAACYLQRKTAERLHRTALFLEKKGLRLKVYDGYRPLAVQKIFWELLPDPRYIADPILGSRHNRGSAIDLTLIDLKGDELSMPTEFDDFSSKAHRDYQGSDQEALENRKLLEEAMEQEGFIPFATEWWHFDDPEWEKYPVLDLSFEEVRRYVH